MVRYSLQPLTTASDTKLWVTTVIVTVATLRVIPLINLLLYSNLRVRSWKKLPVHRSLDRSPAHPVVSWGTTRVYDLLEPLAKFFNYDDPPSDMASVRCVVRELHKHNFTSRSHTTTLYFHFINCWAISSAGVLRFYTIIQIIQLQQWL